MGRVIQMQNKQGWNDKLGFTYKSLENWAERRLMRRQETPDSSLFSVLQFWLRESSTEGEPQDLPV